MAELRPIDVEHWARREHFEHYRERVPCSYEVTVDVDVTAFVARLAELGLKTYPAQLWAIATVVNRHDEFRMQLLPDGTPAVWDSVHPMATVFHPDTETFSALVFRYDADFRTFHDEALATIDRHADDTRMFPQDDRPHNVFDVSSLPWTSFTGFSLQVRDGRDHLLPIFTLGRYRRVDDVHGRAQRTRMPVSLQINHAAADGFHTGRLLNELDELLAEPGWLR